MKRTNLEPLKISTLLPVMNEIYSLNETVKSLESLNPSVSFEHIIILSPDSTAASIENAHNLKYKYNNKVSVIIQEIPGLGGALRSGILFATGDYILMMHQIWKQIQRSYQKFCQNQRLFPQR